MCSMMTPCPDLFPAATAVPLLAYHHCCCCIGAAAVLAGEGADFLLGEVTDTISRVRTEQGLLTYLSCLKALGGAAHLRSLKAITRLRLQSELYSLTSPGGGGCDDWQAAYPVYRLRVTAGQAEPGQAHVGGCVLGFGVCSYSHVGIHTTATNHALPILAKLTPDYCSYSGA